MPAARATNEAQNKMLVTAGERSIYNVLILDWAASFGDLLEEDLQMIERHLVLSLLLRDMGKNIGDLNEFEGRKYLQKIVYLAQQGKFGLDMGFGFSLHPHGPYSKELSECARMMLAQKVDCEDFAKRHKFHPTAIAGIEKLKILVGTKAGSFSELDFLEAAATLHFLWTVSLKHLPDRERKQKVIATCNELKPQFAPDACRVILGRLETEGLLAA